MGAPSTPQRRKAQPGAPALLLGHGASGSAASMQPWVRALAEHGLEARALDLPLGRVERAAAVFSSALTATPDAAIGGHSFGGRAASICAAERPVRALVLLSYPLHRPGHPEALRTEHWEHITCPVLLLSGERDPFAQIDLLRREVQRLSEARLVTYPGEGHGLLRVARDASDRIARFLQAVRSGTAT